MQVDLFRVILTEYYSIGIIFVDRVFYACSLEDTVRDIKVPEETCIPAGTYELALRQFGKHHEVYKERFSFHIGMIEILDVPNFTNVLIHIGNYSLDTSGCILVGGGFDISIEPARLVNSTFGYTRLYKKITPVLIAEEKVILSIYDSAYFLNKVN
jgi:hypothetical protein